MSGKQWQSQLDDVGPGTRLESLVAFGAACRSVNE